MRESDLGAATALTRQLGWPHTEQDWRLHFQTGAGIVATVTTDAGETPIGTTLWWCYGSDAGTLGLIIVDPRYQGLGIGRRMMEHALAEVGNRRLYLVATLAGKKLYERCGFLTTGVIEQRQGEMACSEPIPCGEDVQIRCIESRDLALLKRMDRQALQCSRTQLLQALLAVAYGVVLERDGQPVGMALARVAGRGRTLGPVLAADMADAKLMLSHVIANQPGFYRIDVPQVFAELIAWLEQIGLHCVDEGLMMDNRQLREGGEERPVETGSLLSFALVSQAFI